MKSLTNYIKESISTSGKSKLFENTSTSFKSISDFKRALSEKEMINILLNEVGKKDHYYLDKEMCNLLFKDFATKFESGMSVALGNEWDSYIQGFYIKGNKLMFDMYAGGDSTDENTSVSYDDFMKSSGLVTIKFPLARINAVYDEKTRLKIANCLFDLMQTIVDGQEMIRK